MKFIIKERISRRDTHEMIMLFSRNGKTYDYLPRFKSDADIKNFFATNGIEYDDLVEKCRNYNKAVPLVLVENLLGDTWQVTTSEGIKGTASVVSADGDEEYCSIEGAGVISITYYYLFEKALEDFKNCINTMHYADFLSSITNGIASIEAYVNRRAFLYNKHNSVNQLIDDRDNKVSFDDKVETWIPTMLHGRKLDKSRIDWFHFKILKSIRDKKHIHPKSVAIGINYEELCKNLNIFKSGIVKFLVNLHLLFDEQIPSKIIRAAFFPEIELKEGE